MPVTLLLMRIPEKDPLWNGEHEGFKNILGVTGMCFDFLLWASLIKWILT